MATLDVESVKAFVLVADLGSFTKAAHALDSSQAAISVKVKRLEDRLGYRLFDRTPRQVRLSNEGRSFLTPAREFLAAHEKAITGLSAPTKRLAIGISDQLAGPSLPRLLTKISAYDSAMLVEVHIDSSRNLLGAFDRESLDAIIVRREDDHRDGDILARERYGWFASPEWEFTDIHPLRLASLASSCGVRTIATQLLDKAGIRWTEVFVGGGMAAVGAAVSAGLAVAAMAYSVAPPGTVNVGGRYNFPALPESDVVLHSNAKDSHARTSLKILASTFRGGESAANYIVHQNHPRSGEPKSTDSFMYRQSGRHNDLVMTS